MNTPESGDNTNVDYKSVSLNRLIYFLHDERFSINENSVLLKAVYKDIKYWQKWEGTIRRSVISKGHPDSFIHIVYTVIYLLDSLDYCERIDYYNKVTNLKIHLGQDFQILDLVKSKIDDKKKTIEVVRRIIDFFKVTERHSLLRKFIVRILGTYDVRGLIAFLDYFQEVYEQYYS